MEACVVAALFEDIVAILGWGARGAGGSSRSRTAEGGRWLIDAVDLPTMAAWLGRERLDTVRIYSQPDEAALERAAAALEQH
jgi:hypothetical protein